MSDLEKQFLYLEKGYIELSWIKHVIILHSKYINSVRAEGLVPNSNLVTRMDVPERLLRALLEHCVEAVQTTWVSPLVNPKVWERRERI